MDGCLAMGVDAHRSASFRIWGAGPIGPTGTVADDAPMKPPLTLRGRPTLRARLRAAWRAPELDEALANGTDPLASDELALRAAHLVKPGTRAKLSRALEQVVKQVATRGPSPPGPTILRREPIARNRPALLALARRLRSDGLHCLSGLAMADRLIGFGDSPLYMALDPLQLTYRVEEVLAALEPGWDGQPADTPHPVQPGRGHPCT
jgi:hypothetical protein